MSLVLVRFVIFHMVLFVQNLHVPCVARQPVVLFVGSSPTPPLTTIVDYTNVIQILLFTYSIFFPQSFFTETLKELNSFISRKEQVTIRF